MTLTQTKKNVIKHGSLIGFPHMNTRQNTTTAVEIVPQVVKGLKCHKPQVVTKYGRTLNTSGCW